MTSARSIRYLVVVLGAGIGLAACGSSSPSNTSATGKAAAALAYSQCMRAHGVPSFPDPGGNGRGGLQIQQSQRSGSGPSLSVNGVAVNAPAFQSAMQNCRRFLPDGGHPRPLSASQRQAMLRFAQCMRAHGVNNFPDPTFGANGTVGIRFGASSAIDPKSPAFQAAQKACGPGGPGFELRAQAPGG